MRNKDKIQGKGKQIYEKVTVNLGSASDDHQAEADGSRERAEGEIRETPGKARRKGKDADRSLQD